MGKQWVSWILSALSGDHRAHSFPPGVRPQSLGGESILRKPIVHQRDVTGAAPACVAPRHSFTGTGYFPTASGTPSFA